MPSLSGADKVADRLATLEGKLDTPVPSIYPNRK